MRSRRSSSGSAKRFLWMSSRRAARMMASALTRSWMWRSTSGTSKLAASSHSNLVMPALPLQTSWGRVGDRSCVRWRRDAFRSWAETRLPRLLGCSGALDRRLGRTCRPRRSHHLLLFLPRDGLYGTKVSNWFGPLGWECRLRSGRGEVFHEAPIPKKTNLYVLRLTPEETPSVGRKRFRVYFTRRPSANVSPSQKIESSSCKHLFADEEEPNHWWALAIFEMSPNRVLDHLGEFGPGFALSSNAVP